MRPVESGGTVVDEVPFPPILDIPSMALAAGPSDDNRHKTDDSICSAGDGTRSARRMGCKCVRFLSPLLPERPRTSPSRGPAQHGRPLTDFSPSYLITFYLLCASVAMGNQG